MSCLFCLVKLQVEPVMLDLKAVFPYDDLGLNLTIWTRHCIRSTYALSSEVRFPLEIYRGSNGRPMAVT